VLDDVQPHVLAAQLAKQLFEGLEVLEGGAVGQRLIAELEIDIGDVENKSVFCMSP
jgi:hypothetical protein